MHATRLRTLGLSGLALALAILVATAWASLADLRRFRESADEVEHTRRALRANRRLLDLMRDSEIGQRGFLLTGRPAYLEPYNRAVRAVPETMREVTALWAEWPEQQGRLRELQSLVTAKLAEMQRTVSLRRQGELDAALAVVLSDHGRELMERIREVSTDLEAREYARWRASSEALEDSVQRSHILNVAGAGFLTILVAAALLALRNSARQREQLITDLHQARQSAEEVRDLLRTSLYSIGDAVITTDDQGRVLMMNAVAERLTGYTEKEACGQPIETVFHIVNEQTRSNVENPVRRVLQEGRIVGLANHTVLISKTGADVPLDDSGAPIRDRDGTLKGVVLVFRDITERKRAEEELLQSERRFRTVADAAPVMIWSATPDGRREYFNKTWLDFTGRPAEEQIGHGWKQGIHPDDRQRMQDVLDASFAARVPFTLEYRLLRHDGSYRRVLSQGAPRLSFDGELLGFIGSVVDIEERKLTEEKMRQTAKLESLGVLAGGIAHDFNNLLVGIMGNASLLEDYIAADSPQREILENLLKASERAAQLTRQMLAYSGRGRFYVELLDLSEQARQITGLVHASIPKHVSVRLSLDRNLPSILADASQIDQLLMNLVINAAEAVPEPAGWVEIRTSAEQIDAAFIASSLATDDVQPGEYVMLTVSDNGAGMDEATLARIFDPFFTTKFTGRGLGLAAALGIVRGHRGGINVRSAPGQGTTFRVFFPVAEAHREQPAPPEKIVVAGTGRILVVDDEDVVREAARHALEQTGYEVVVANDGKQALDILSGRPDGIDLVLLDMTMPEMSAEETLPRIRAICPRVPVVASSGYNEVEALQRFGKSIDGFLQKPYTVPQLSLTVRRALTGT